MYISIRAICRIIYTNDLWGMNRVVIAYLAIMRYHAIKRMIDNGYE